MGRNLTRRKSYGFYKAPSKLPMFTHLVASDLAKLDAVAERFGVGQGTLASFYLNRILNNEDFLRVLNVQLEEWPELQEIRKLQALYAKTKRSETDHHLNLTTARAKCAYCGKEMYEWFLPEHVERLCTKVERPKALPDKREVVKVRAR